MSHVLRAGQVFLCCWLVVLFGVTAIHLSGKGIAAGKSAPPWSGSWRVTRHLLNFIKVPCHRM
jgi:hypothetical protein